MPACFVALAETLDLETMLVPALSCVHDLLQCAECDQCSVFVYMVSFSSMRLQLAKPVKGQSGDEAENAF